ncbi:hypothetical protein D9758_013994 [Tetrapyrgos nigripes]|uniref:Uncharacterized protein n=1 Tax=Tetrapyrgos nigripes TaxID=182062 RepID=A0A8H5LJY9_9AGAR|nr:hypothetical protein D9758_013994 [Tetrapyrgos nigripes]
MRTEDLKQDQIKESSQLKLSTFQDMSNLTPNDYQALSKRNKEHPYYMWYFTVSFIGLLTTLVTVFSIAFSKLPRRPDSKRNRSTSNECLALSRLPLVLVSVYRVLAYRTTLNITKPFSINLTEVGVCATALFTLEFINTTSIASESLNIDYWKDRAGIMAASQFPLIVVLGMKNNVISHIATISGPASCSGVSIISYVYSEWSHSTGTCQWVPDWTLNPEPSLSLQLSTSSTQSFGFVFSLMRVACPFLAMHLHCWNQANFNQIHLHDSRVALLAPLRNPALHGHILSLSRGYSKKMAGRTAAVGQEAVSKGNLALQTGLCDLLFLHTLSLVLLFRFQPSRRPQIYAHALNANFSPSPSPHHPPTAYPDIDETTIGLVDAGVSTDFHSNSSFWSNNLRQTNYDASTNVKANADSSLG